MKDNYHATHSLEGQPFWLAPTQTKAPPLNAAEQIERMRNRRRAKKVSRGLRATVKKIAKLKRPPAELKTKADAMAKILIELRKLVNP